MAEILAPSGSPESLEAALRCGCDAVYLGGESFSARQNATNFTNEQLKQAVFECHKRGVKVYQAINTLVFDEQLEECKQAVEFAAEIGIDGLITQDLCLVQIAKKCCPQLEIHSSTQMTIHTENGVEMTKLMGFSRAVLSRELPLDIIEKLSKLGTETEVFVHGALCMSVSGQCYMSAVIGSRSANRGLCAQACRLPCSAEWGKERYDLSLKDMSYLEDIKLLENAGVSSLKIEGRMKRPEYVAKAVDSCKKALSGESFDVDELENVFSRSGFTKGYLYRRLGKEMFGTRQKDDVTSSAKALPKLHELYRHEEKRERINFEFYAQADEECILKASDTKGNCVYINGEIPQQAQKRGCDEESVLKQLSKLGDTIFTLGKTDFDIGEMLWISPAGINAMRREACEKLCEIRADKNTKKIKFTDCGLLDFDEYKSAKPQTIRITITNLSQLEYCDFEDIELCGVPIDLCIQAAAKYPKDKLMAVMPRFTFDEKKQLDKLKEIKSCGITKMLAANLAHIKAAKDLNFELHLDYGFNIGNSSALYEAKMLGANDAVLSFEMKASQISAIKKSMPIGIYAYGNIPLMLTANCPVSQAVGCEKCTGKLIDRTNREFKVKCSKKLGYVEIINSDVLYIADKLESFKRCDFLMLNFFEETSHDVRKIISAYKFGSQTKPSTLTRGLYFRGVL